MKRFSQLTQTATEADLVSGNFLAIDVPGVGGATKKLPGDKVAKKSEGTSEIHNLATTITAFRTGDVIPVDGPSGTAKMAKDDLLNETAQNALAGNVAPEFVPNETNALAGMLYVHDGTLYYAKEDCSGAWDASKFLSVSLDEIVNLYYEKAKNENAGEVKFTATSGAVVDVKVFTEVNAGDQFILRVVGDSVVDANGFNCRSGCYGQNSGLEFEEQFASVTQLYKWYTINATKPADYLYIRRSAASANGTITLQVIPQKLLLSYIKGLLDSSICNLQEQIDALDLEVNGESTYADYDLTGASTGYYYYYDGATVSTVANASSSYKDISFGASDAGRQLRIKTGSSALATDTRYYVLVDGNNNVKFAIKNGSIVSDGGVVDVPVAVESGWKLMCSWNTSQGTPTISYVASHTPSIKESIENSYIKYVSTAGDDDNDGSQAFPKKTISAAVAEGAETIIVMGGVYTDNEINLSKSIHDKITIKGVQGEKVVFKKADSLLLGDGSETLVTGYTKVYSASTSSPGYSGANQWLFFDGLADTATEIQASELHPLERGLSYRNDCTRSVKTSASTLADALTEIENAATFKWFYDNGKLYFNRPDSTSVYPIYRGYGTYLTTRENQSVDISNIEFRYGVVNLAKLNIATLYNVSSKYVYGAGCFVYDNSISVTFDHCEASSAFFGNNGDGFNAHSTAGVDSSAKYCQATLRECWSHDNLDDGYSDHELAESCIDGGLFEYNGKAGVTPAYGCHCVCKNVLSRHNFNGFYYVGDNNGNRGQMICYGCVSESNSGVNYGYGFRVIGSGNGAILVGCKSINDVCGYRCDGGSWMRLVDCGCSNPSSGDASTGAGAFAKIKTSIVE